METLEKNVEAKALLIGIILAFIAVILKQKEVMFGIWAGTLISILNFKLLAKYIESRPSGKKLGRYGFLLNYVLRYGIMAVILWLAITKEMSFFIGTAIGLFVVRFAIYIDIFLPDKHIGHWNHNK